MKLSTVKCIAIAVFCLILAGGNIYNFIKNPANAVNNIVFYDAPNNVGFEASPYDDGLIDINTADADALMSLPGIGKVKAAAIIEYREKYGRFVSTEELMEVRGIGQATYDKLKNRVTIRGNDVNEKGTGQDKRTGT